MDQDRPRYRIEDVREAEQSRVDYLAARAHGAARPDPPVLVIRQQLWLLRREAKRKARRALGDRAVAKLTRLRRGSATRREPQAPGPARPSVSVVVTVFNNGPVLQRAIDSVVAQTMPDWELVLWDDGSTDPATLAVLDRAEGLSITKLRGENRGVIAARRSGAERASGDVLVFLDPDDALEPTYLEKALLTFARYPGVDVLCPTTRVLNDDGSEHYWYSVPFDEHRLAYENTVPISSAMRRRVWDAVGGMPEEMAEGFEDWGMWRAAAAAGFRGLPLPEALFRYTKSQTTGRDAGAQQRRDELERRLKQLNPLVTHQVEQPVEDVAALRHALATRVFHFPDSGRPVLVVFMAWMTRGGGAEALLLSVIPELSREFDVVVIATSQPPQGSASAVNEFLRVTPYVYDVPGIVGPGAVDDMVRTLLYRLRGPNILLVGSLWAFDHLSELRFLARGVGRVVDLEFNHRVHVPQVLHGIADLDVLLVAHRRLQSLFRDYYEVPRPVEVLYVAPPERDVSTRPKQFLPGRARLRIGWLGRNSPEKRPDLVARIAAALPEADFVMAGSGLENLPAEPENVSVVGWVEDAAQFIAGLDFLLNTSDFEGISLGALEALQLGTPVLTRDVGGMTELVRDGENGLVYDQEHVRGLADRLRDPELVARLRSTVDTERLPPQFRFDAMIGTLRKVLLGATQADAAVDSVADDPAAVLGSPE